MEDRKGWIVCDGEGWEQGVSAKRCSRLLLDRVFYRRTLVEYSTDNGIESARPLRSMFAIELIPDNVRCTLSTIASLEVDQSFAVMKSTMKTYAHSPSIIVRLLVICDSPSHVLLRQTHLG